MKKNFILALFLALFFGGCASWIPFFGDDTPPNFQNAQRLAKEGKDEEALQEFKRLCQADDANGCLFVALAYQYEKGTKKELNTAKEYFEKGCKLKNANSCLGLGTLQANESKNSEALVNFMKSCELNSPQGCFYAGVLNSVKATPLNHINAYNFYKSSCELGGGDGCFNTAMSHEIGLGTLKDLKNAALYHQKGCALGSSKSCTNLAVMYAEGRGIKKDLKKSIANFTLACKLGNKMACDNLKAFGK